MARREARREAVSLTGLQDSIVIVTGAGAPGPVDTARLGSFESGFRETA
jgi:hypothetical protein